MKRALHWKPLIGVALVAVTMLSLVGVAQAFERSDDAPYAQPTPNASRMGPGLMWGNSGQSPDTQFIPDGSRIGSGMLWGNPGQSPSAQPTPDASRIGPGMMWGSAGQGVYTGTLPYGGYGMMDGGMMAMMGMMGGMMQPGGMMGHVASPSLLGIEPLTLADAVAAVEDYLAGLGNEDLVLGGVMIFDNHAYAQIVEQSTGVGAVEVLIDPVTLAVWPEPGPNMMWNTKYGSMSGSGMMGMMGGGMMGVPGMMPQQGGPQQGDMMGGQAEVSADMPVSAEEAIQTAQRYLDAYLPGATADETAADFYGYYTIHILRGGKVVGMLSVNGYTRQVIVHTWHGDFVEVGEGPE